MDAGMIIRPPAPIAMTMNTTSIPSSITILKAVANATASIARPDVAACRRKASVCALNA
jgi:hypothetical protein